MASWTEIKGYVFSNYKVSSDEGNLMSLLFDMGEGRSQLVFIGYLDLDEPLIRFSSPIGKVSQITAERVIEAASSTPFGVERVGDVYALRHVQLAATVDGSEIDMPIQLVTGFADHLEKTLGLGDTF